ncbi:MAG: hypothetical protein KJ727_00505 [Acidobacteria bacterium]|nr:hypothetical protein [Acidobacteriota bacterium]MCG2815411.1 hypothetical protein [Candidatus Aminicenantes bacterium]
MLNGMKLAVAILVAILIIAVFIFADAPQTDEELNKKYAPILGDYAFDVAALGMGEVTIEDDDEGEYTRCHVKNESMSMDVFGDKR